MDALDKQDKAIIDVLKRGGRLSTRDIAKKSGIPAATVYKRMKKMEKDGVIEGYTVILNQAKVGKTLLAYVVVRTKPGADYTTMMNDMKKHEEIEDIGAIAGEWDIILKIRTANIQELDDLVFNYLRKFPEITQTQTLIVMRGWK